MMASDRFRENVLYLSSLGRYNTERRPMVRQYFDRLLREGDLAQEAISIEDVREFGRHKKPVQEDGNPGFDKIFEELLLTLPEDINPQDFQGYLLFRYSHLEEPLHEAGQFGIHDLLSFEALLRDAILEDTELILSDLHRFESKEEYAEFSNISEPDNQFRQVWHERITLDIQSVLKEMLTDTERELLDADEKSDRYYQAVSRIRRKINEELTEDVQLLEENHPDLLEELQEVVCDEE